MSKPSTYTKASIIKWTSQIALGRRIRADGSKAHYGRPVNSAPLSAVPQTARDAVLRFANNHHRPAAICLGQPAPCLNQNARISKLFLKEKFAVKSIGVFGSYLRGEQSDQSDIDILIEFHSTIDDLIYI